MRETFLEAAATLFAERGFDGPTVREICQRAGYSVGAFYRCFRDRDSLIGETLGFVISREVERLLAERPLQGEGALERYANVVLYAGGGYGTPAWRLHHTLAACARSERVRAQFAEAIHHVHQTLVRDAQRAGVSDAEPFAELFVSLLLGRVALAELQVA